MTAHAISYASESAKRERLQALSPVDRAIRYADSLIREAGYPGIETQMHVHFRGEVSVDVLQRGISRLSLRYPILAARLVELQDQEEERGYWQFRPGEVCRLHEATLASNSMEEVFRYAGEVLSADRDLAVADPIGFHLLHCPDGRDVLLIQYSHVLMDNRMAMPLLRELNLLTRSTSQLFEMESSFGEPDRPITRNLRQFSRERRHAAVRAVMRPETYAPRGKAATLIPAGVIPSAPTRLRILTQVLGQDETTELRNQTVALCGYPSLSMSVLASAFRAVDRLGSPNDDSHDFVATLGIPLRINRHHQLVFHNLTSIVPIRLASDGVGDRQRAVRLLSRQLQELLHSNIDLGVLESIGILGRRFHHLDWILRHILLHSCSLWYAHFGSLDALGDILFGQQVETAYFAGGPVWPTTGLSLLVNQYRGRTHFQATFDPQLISDSSARNFLAFLLSDLRSRPSSRQKIPGTRPSRAGF